MGLDQTLTAKRYIGGNYEHRGITGTISIDENLSRYDHDKGRWVNDPANKKSIVNTSDMSSIASIEFHLIQWRKANAIHRWFVENVQDNVDDCGSYYVSRDQLEELLRLCKEAIVSLDASKKESKEYVTGWNREGDITSTKEVFVDVDHVESILPTTEGFFFGSSDYDDWYKHDLEYTVRLLTEAFNNPQYDNCSFEYNSSW